MTIPPDHRLREAIVPSPDLDQQPLIELQHGIHTQMRTTLNPAVSAEKTLQNRRRNLARALEGFAGVTEKDRVLLITDQNEHNTDQAVIDLIKEYCQERKIPVTIIMAGVASYDEILAATRQHTFVWNAHDWAPDEAPWNAFVDTIKVSQRRMAHCAGVTADSLDAGGALSEDKERLTERLQRMEHVLKDAWGFHVTSSYGTDLWLELKHGERRWFRDTGVIREGGWDNLPGGEIFTTPHEHNVEGVLILPVLHPEVDEGQGVDRLVRLTVRGGRVVRIDGGKSADTLRQYWEKWGKKHQADTGENPWQVVQCAEIAFGANEFARSIVSDPAKPWTYTGVHFIEGEKRLHTMHIAFGSTKHGEPGTEGLVETEPHLDFVLPRTGLNVTAFKSREDWEGRKNGEPIAQNGNWKHW